MAQNRVVPAACLTWDDPRLTRPEVQCRSELREGSGPIRHENARVEILVRHSRPKFPLFAVTCVLFQTVAINIYTR
jgi:hypothetical protein